jgi:hypothetical protein
MFIIIYSDLMSLNRKWWKEEKYYYSILDFDLNILRTYKVTEDELREYYKKEGEDMEGLALIENKGIYDIMNKVSDIVDEKYFENKLSDRIGRDVIGLGCINIKPEDVPKKDLRDCLKRYQLSEKRERKIIDKKTGKIIWYASYATYRRRDVKGNPIRIYFWGSGTEEIYVERF